ncbi:MAG: inorganic phosphate transporter [Saprospiraceae bacterium]|nr:inorganic phosphate transporter [Saprospiraceae bacterium]
MEAFYLILIIVLFILAISDLVVGVSNDAVNFLNAAVGAKASSFKIILMVAAFGIVIGATFSSGMMEVARKGIFHPELFYFSEIIILFLAVMVTDVILLDMFNTYGMPTSTTVSIVFELLGAAVAVSTIKIFTDPNALHLYEYINSAKAMAIISGILLSVFVAFTIGIIAQYLSRLFFSFDYSHRMKKFGPVWGGLGIMAITYFMLIKGAKGASFMSAELIVSITENTEMLLLGSLILWTVILYLLNNFFKVDILKVLVLVGTFALSMAFAGNDLVNFIGVPLAGLNAYQLYAASGTLGSEYLMSGLAGQVPTPTILLLIAGVIMVVTLYISSKARSVVQTSLDLARQDEGRERFASSLLSRKVVRSFNTLATSVNGRLPKSWKNYVEKQFDQTAFIARQVQYKEDTPPSFDMIRASVTLVTASILIAIGTNLKLPLSTTYVTFMVFMGASLADRAWGRESAVYRVTGVLSVIGGWFFTALSAFIMAFLVACVFYFGGIAGIAGMVLLAGYLVYRTHRYHKERMDEQEAYEARLTDGEMSKVDVIHLFSEHLETFLNHFSTLIQQSIDALGKEDLKSFRETLKAFKPIQDKLHLLKMDASQVLDGVSDEELEVGHLYMLVVDYLHEMSKGVRSILKSNFDHVDNQHKPLLPVQIEELKNIHELLIDRYKTSILIFKRVDLEEAEALTSSLYTVLKATRRARKNQIKRIQNHEVGTRNSHLFLNQLSEMRNLALFANRIVDAYKDLFLSKDKNGESTYATLVEDIKNGSTHKSK